MSQFTITNNDDSLFTLPAPFSGVLLPGDSITLDGTPDIFLLACSKTPVPYLAITIATRTLPSAGTGIAPPVAAAMAAGLQLPRIVYGQVSIPEDATTAQIVELGEAFASKLAVVSFAQADNGDAVSCYGFVNSAGELTIGVPAVPGTGKTALINYSVDGRV